MLPDPSAKQAQRLWPRWFIAGTKPVRIDLGPAGSGPLVDISGGGFRVQSLAPLRRGAEVPVRIDIPDKPEALRCSGIVVWSKPNGAAGIRFTSLDESQKAALHAWLSELEQGATGGPHGQVQDEFTTVVSQIRGAQLNNADALNMIVRRVNGLSSVSGATIALGTPENMVCMATAGEAPEVGSSIPAVIGLTGECVFKRKMVHSEDSKNDPRVGRESGFGSAVILPLVVNGEVRGVLEVFSKRAYSFTPTSIDALEKFADAVIFVTHGIVTQRRLATAKPSLVINNSALGPKPGPAHTAAPAASAATISAAPPPMPVANIAHVVASPNPAPLTPVAMSTPAQSTAIEVVPVAASIAAPVATPSARSKSFEWEERRERPRAVPTPKLPPRWQEERQSQRSSMPKWMVTAAAVLVVGAVPAWYFMTRHPRSVTAANAATVASSAPDTAVAPMPEPSTVQLSSASVQRPPSPAKVVAVAAPVVLKNVAPPPVPKHEEKAPAAEIRKPEPEPIILAANTPKAPRPVDLDSVVPVKMPAAMQDPAGVTQIPLPATSQSAPKLAAPVPEVRTGGSLIKKVNPVYPPLAKTAGIQGIVELQVHIAPDGTVDKVRRMSGQPMLASAAIDAVKQWRYDPAKLNGKPVEMETTVRLNFDLAR